MKSLMANLLAVGLAVGATWVDLHVGDLALLLIMAMAFPMLLALLWPRQFWMWAVVVSLPLPLMLTMKRFVQHENFTPDYFAAWVAILPALVGATAGWGFRRIVRNIRAEEAVVHRGDRGDRGE
jgi:hypothetical protein